MPLLDLVQNLLSLDAGSLDIGICAECWKNSRAIYAWALAKRPVLWAHPSSLTGGRILAAPHIKGHERGPSHCLKRHVVVRDMFMATERDWTGSGAY
jgi:hypothetical protein